MISLGKFEKEELETACLAANVVCPQENLGEGLTVQVIDAVKRQIGRQEHPRKAAVVKVRYAVLIFDGDVVASNAVACQQSVFGLPKGKKRICRRSAEGLINERFLVYFVDVLAATEQSDGVLPNFTT